MSADVIEFNSWSSPCRKVCVADGGPVCVCVQNMCVRSTVQHSDNMQGDVTREVEYSVKLHFL